MSKRPSFGEVFLGKSKPFAFFLAIAVILLIWSVSHILLRDFLEHLVYWRTLELLLAILSITAGGLVYYVRIWVEKRKSR